MLSNINLITAYTHTFGAHTDKRAQSIKNKTMIIRQICTEWLWYPTDHVLCLLQTLCSCIYNINFVVNTLRGSQTHWWWRATAAESELAQPGKCTCSKLISQCLGQLIQTSCAAWSSGGSPGKAAHFPSCWNQAHDKLGSNKGGHSASLKSV